MNLIALLLIFRIFLLKSLNKTKVSNLMLGNFFPIAFFKIYSFSLMFIILQILTSVKEITLVTWMPHAWTPKDRIFVRVTPDILEMEATAQVLDAFLLKPFPSKKKHYHICETCFTSIPCIDPFTPKISLVILLTVCHTILMMSVLRIWYWINW